jgi:Protein of unknown function (DUF2721)
MEATPFASLTLIVAPAILTNASSVLVLSTSNRLARAVDRARSLAEVLGRAGGAGPQVPYAAETPPLARVERRALLLLGSLRLFYLSLGSFAAASFTSLLGAIFASAGRAGVHEVTVIIAAVAGVTGVGGLVVGTGMLVRETRIAVSEVTDEIALLREQMRHDDAHP